VFLANLSSGYLQLGMTVAVLAGLCLTMWMALRSVVHRRRTCGWPAVGHRVIGVLRSGSIALTSTIIAAAGIAALMSSRTDGSAFAAPLVAPLAVAASRGVESIRSVQRQRVWTIGSVVAVAPAAVLGFLPIRYVVLAQHTVDLPALPAVNLTIVDSRGTLRTYVDGGGVMPAGAPTPGTPEHGRQWFAASARIVDAAHTQTAELHQPAVLVFTFRHRLLNPNTLGMDSFLRFQQQLPMVMLNPALPGQTVDDVAAVVEPIAKAVTMVLTADDGPNEFTPPLPPRLGEIVVQRLGFVLSDRFQLLDGRWVSLWVPPAKHA
jgi:hypothetical protein